MSKLGIFAKKSFGTVIVGAQRTPIGTFQG